MLFQRKEASRKELFRSVERTVLKPLPTGVYQLKDYTRAKVQKIGYVYFSPDWSYYRVPYRYIGRSTQIHYTKDIVEVYHSHERIAFHKRAARGCYNTVGDQLSSTHRNYLDWSPEYFKRQAAALGPSVLVCVTGLFTRFGLPRDSLQTCHGHHTAFKGLRQRKA